LIPIRDGKVDVRAPKPNDTPEDYAAYLGVKLYQNWTEFCKFVRRKYPGGAGGNMCCVLCDIRRAQETVDRGLRYPEPVLCDMGLTEFVMPIRVGGEIVAVGLPGQRKSDNNNIMDCFHRCIQEGKIPEEAERHHDDLTDRKGDILRVEDLPGIDDLPDTGAVDEVRALRDQIAEHWKKARVDTTWLTDNECEKALDYCTRIMYRAQQIEEVASERFRLETTVHTVRQPLSSLRQDQREAFDLMNQTDPTSTNIQDALDALRGARMNADIANQVLDGPGTALRLSKGEPLRLDRRRGNISNVLLAIRDRYAGLAAARCLEIELRDSVFKLPDMVFDAANLELLFGNLVDNAIKYAFAGKKDKRTGECEERKTIDINAWLDGNTTCVEVSDYGLTITEAEENDQSVFGLHIRGQNRDKKRTIEGSGIGLYVVREIARAHDGDLAVKITSRSSKPEPAGKNWVETGRAAFTVTLALPYAPK